MLYAVDGVALGGWQLVDLALMALVAIELLSLIFLKVVIILLGALLYATGPITIGLVATESGAAIARAWASAVAMLIALPIVWATLFAVGALLVGDAGTAGPLIAGDSSIGSLLGGVILAVAGAASLWLCLRAAREAMGLLRMQLGGLLALSHRGSSGPTRVTASRSSSVDSLRRFGTRVAQAAGGAAGELAAAGHRRRRGRPRRPRARLPRTARRDRHRGSGRASRRCARRRLALRSSWVARAPAPSPSAWQKPEPPAGTQAPTATPPRTPPTVTAPGPTARARGRAAGQSETKASRTTGTAAAQRRRPPRRRAGGHALVETLDRPRRGAGRRRRRRDPAAGKARNTDRRSARPAPQPATPPRKFTPSPRSGKRPGRGKR